MKKIFLLLSITLSLVLLCSCGGECDKCDFSSWKTTKEATCTEPGTEERECSVCGAKEQRETTAAHEFDKWIVTDGENNASCEEKIYASVCEICGKSAQRIGDSNDHKYSSEYEHDNDKHWRVCEKCGFNSAKKDHTMIDSSCKICGYEEANIISYQTARDTLAAVSSGEIDVAFIDSTFAYDLDESLCIVENYTIYTETFGIAFKKDSALTPYFKWALSELERTGRLDYYEDLFGYETSPLFAEECTEKPDGAIPINTLVVGYTKFPPNAYVDENGALTGLDIELAKEACALLGIDVQFQEIDWYQKETLIYSYQINCIWNAMTITEERKDVYDFVPYFINETVAVIRKEDVNKYIDEASMKDATIGAEAGSVSEAYVLSTFGDQ